MNKVATKEPSMDEILSSIRQIIADDDAASARPDPLTLVASSPDLDDQIGSEDPLPLSRDQILRDMQVGRSEPPSSSTYVDDETDDEDTRSLRAEFIDPDDVTFDVEKVDMPPVSVPITPVVVTAPVTETPRPRPTAAEAAPMPDPKLSADIAEELLEPATNAAVRANLVRLNNLGVGTPGLTIEAMMREMLRPMLKEWLDEHLPTLVERVVEKEIARISRGVE
jgi:cell pole-organizing protein PopZ